MNYPERISASVPSHYSLMSAPSFVLLGALSWNVFLESRELLRRARVVINQTPTLEINPLGPTPATSERGKTELPWIMFAARQRPSMVLFYAEPLQ